jgi:hypothetical protein
MHSLLNVIKRFLETDSFWKDSKFRPRFAIGEFLQHNFLENILISKVIQCISFIPIIEKYSSIYARQPSTYFDTILGMSEINALVLTT